MITDTQSYSAVLRDVLFACTVTLPFFNGFTARRCKMLMVQPELIPYLGVYIVDEIMEPDGDYNVGDIRFMHTLRLGFSVIIAENDPLLMELKLDEAFWSIMNGIWRNASVTNLIRTSGPDDVGFEGVLRGTRKHVFGATGLNNDLPYAELQYEPVLRYRANYPPVITDTLDHIHVETVPLADDGTVPDAAAVLRIISEYEFTP